MLTPLAQALTPLGKANTVFNPTQLNWLFYYNLGMQSGYVDNDLINVFTDFSGNNRHATQNTGTNKPTFKTTAGALPNARPTAFFTTNDFLNVPAIDLTGASSIETFIIFQCNTGDTNILLESSTNYNSNVGAFVLARTALNGFQAGHHGNVGISYVSSNSAYLNWKIGQSTHDLSLVTNEVSIFVDGASPAITYIANANNSGSFGNFPFFIGGRGGVSTFLTGYIYAIGLRVGLLSATERTNLYNYFHNDTGI